LLFNLTADDAPIYHPQRWGEAKLELERSFDQRIRKTKFLQFQLAKSAINGASTGRKSISG